MMHDPFAAETAPPPPPQLVVVLHRLALAVLGSPAGDLVALVCPPFRGARSTALKSQPGEVWPSPLGPPAWHSAVTLAAMVAGGAAFAAETLPDPFSADERADFTARGWLLDPAAPAVLAARAHVDDLPAAPVPGWLVGSPKYAAAFCARADIGTLAMIDALAELVRRRGPAPPEKVAALRLGLLSRLANGNGKAAIPSSNAPGMTRPRVLRRAVASRNMLRVVAAEGVEITPHARSTYEQDAARIEHDDFDPEIHERNRLEVAEQARAALKARAERAAAAEAASLARRRARSTVRRALPFSP